MKENEICYYKKANLFSHNKNNLKVDVKINVHCFFFLFENKIVDWSPSSLQHPLEEQEERKMEQSFFNLEMSGKKMRAFF